MNNVLIYCRSQKSESIAEQTADILSLQLQQVGFTVEISHALNLPRLLLNPYNALHIIVETLPLSANEIFFLGIAKAMGKTTVLSVLNSEKKQSRSLLDYIKPDAFSVSQTNHLKLYRHITCNKFIFSAFPKSKVAAKKQSFKSEALLIPLQSKIDEAFDYNIDKPVYFDGRKLTKNQGSSQLRKKWNELINAGKINTQHHLILSDSKLAQLINEESLVIVLADPLIQNTEFISWLNISMNKNSLIVLNDFQATGFSTYWTSGHNSIVIAAQDWKKQIEYIPSQLNEDSNFVSSSFNSSDLIEPTVNELSRLYSKIWQQKTSLLTSRSVKL